MIADTVCVIFGIYALAAGLGMVIEPGRATRVLDGQLHPDFNADGPSRKRRNGVGLSADGRHVYFAISDAPVNFHSFARLFRDHLGTPNALYLDGVVSRLYAPDLQRDESGLDMGPIVAVVESRAEAP